MAVIRSRFACSRSAAASNNQRTSSSPSKYRRLLSMKRGSQGHSPAERRTVAGKRDVAILELRPVGNYAVRIVFDDLHSTGVFS